MIPSLSCDCLEPKGQAINIEQPDWQQVRDCIDKLDGIRFTEVLLSDGDSQGLLITGGSCGRFMCERTTLDASYTLLNEDQSSEEPVAILENGPADFPKTWVVSRDQVVKAAKYFCEYQSLDPKQSWYSP